MSDEGRVWRTSWLARVGAVVFAIFIVMMASLPSEDGMVAIPPDGSGSYQDAIPFRLLGPGLAALGLAVAYRGRMELRADELVLRSLLTTRTIPLSAIVTVAPTKNGLVIETTDGATHQTPFGIGEKAPLATWLHRRTQADEIAELIMSARP